MKTTIVTPEEAHAIAREAYLYSFPLVETYKTLYQQAIGWREQVLSFPPSHPSG